MFVCLFYAVFNVLTDQSVNNSTDENACFVIYFGNDTTWESKVHKYSILDMSMYYTNLKSFLFVCLNQITSLYLHLLCSYHTFTFLFSNVVCLNLVTIFLSLKNKVYSHCFSSLSKICVFQSAVLRTLITFYIT